MRKELKDAYMINGTRKHIILQAWLTDEPAGTAMREGTGN